jgi:hypothetical protein
MLNLSLARKALMTIAAFKALWAKGGGGWIVSIVIKALGAIKK